MLLSDSAKLCKRSITRVLLEVSREAEEREGGERSERERGIVGVEDVIIDGEGRDVGERWLRNCLSGVGR